MDSGLLKTISQPDYELLDCGDGRKLERYGKIVLSRPDPQALWPKRLESKEWQNAHAVFESANTEGIWKLASGVPKEWPINFCGLTMTIKPTPFKHTGLFPEQFPNWKWIQETIKGSTREISVLNLFGYTGGASLVSAQAGASVCHVDGSKAAVTWAKANAEASGLSEKPTRWIVDDVRAFIKREIKRHKKYDAIVLDPPAFGRGPNGEVWKIEEDLPSLLHDCRALLSDKPLFILISGYAAGYSALAYFNLLTALTKGSGGHVEAKELGIEESPRSGHDARVLPAGIMARWKAGN